MVSLDLSQGPTRHSGSLLHSSFHYSQTHSSPSLYKILQSIRLFVDCQSLLTNYKSNIPIPHPTLHLIPNIFVDCLVLYSDSSLNSTQLVDSMSLYSHLHSLPLPYMYPAYSPSSYLHCPLLTTHSCCNHYPLPILYSNLHIWLHLLAIYSVSEISHLSPLSFLLLYTLHLLPSLGRCPQLLY